MVLAMWKEYLASLFLGVSSFAPEQSNSECSMTEECTAHGHKLEVQSPASQAPVPRDVLSPRLTLPECGWEQSRCFACTDVTHRRENCAVLSCLSFEKSHQNLGGNSLNPSFPYWQVLSNNIH